MAVPTIASLSPSTGHTGGGLVRITGTNFRQQTAQTNPTGPLPVPPPSVEVLFGGVAGVVRVLSATLLEVYTPKSAAGVVDVVVRNIDDDGDLIGAESVTALAAYTFALPDLTVDQYATRAVERLILSLRSELLDEVVPLTHGDFDENPGDNLNITTLAKLPALVLLGPRLLPSSGISANSGAEQDDGTDTGTIDVYQRSAVKDLEFRLIGVTDNHRQMLNLLSITQRFFAKSPFVFVDKDASDSSAGQNTHPIMITQDFQDQSGPNDSNLRQFRGSFVLYGIYFETMDGFTKESRTETTFPAETLTLEPSVEIEV